MLISLGFALGGRTWREVLKTVPPATIADYAAYWKKWGSFEPLQKKRD